MSNTYKKECSMRQIFRTRLSRIMVGAWILARQGAERFGGTACLYFPVALHLLWLEELRAHTRWRSGIGNQFVLPGVEMLQKVTRGQLCLPGIEK